jgi:3-deoxy-D-manno-octulosonic-acid transferase
MYLLYSAALTLALVLGLPFWLLQMARSGKYRAGLSERLGRVPARLRVTGAAPHGNENCIWVHAVSVGEVLAVTRLIAELKKKYPEWRIVVSTTTKTGQALAQARFGESEVFYLPLDLKMFLRPFFRHLRPRLLVLAESEFWMNLLAVAKANDCRVAVVNTRVSDRSLPRYLRIRGLLAKHIFSRIDLVMAQSDQDAERVRQIGVPVARVQVSGNLKFDLSPPAESEIVRKLREALRGKKVLVCGSTVEGEEEIIVDDLRAGRIHLVTILAPRHPERFNIVLDLLSNRGCRVIRRSTWNGEPIENDTVILLDSIGELAAMYSVADYAFVGGSLVPRGGHNILEPAYFGKPIVVGPYTENFRDVIRRFVDEKAIIQASPVHGFAASLLALMSDSAIPKELGERAQRVMALNAGATERTVSALEVLLWMPSTLRSQMTESAGGQQ